MGISPVTVEKFEDLWGVFDMFYSTGPSTAGRLRKEHEGPWLTEDEITQYLTKKGLVRGTGANGKVHVACPWKAEHTTPDNLTSTSYFAGGGFKCLHSHCAQRTTDEFLAAIGWNLEGFEDISDTLEAESLHGSYHLLTISELTQQPSVSWCVKGVLPQQGLAAVYGPSGCGKSFLVIDLAMAVSAGKPWFGLRTKQCSVVYCALEGEGGIAQRVAAYGVQHGESGENVRFLLQPFNLVSTEQRQALAKAIEDTGCGGGVTILDTLNRATPGIDENDSKDMGKTIAAAKQLQALIGGLVILVHHVGKDVTRGLRGHSSLQAALDGVIEVCREGSQLSWQVTKSKDGSGGMANCFRLDVVDLGIDQDGDSSTSCVIAPDETNETKIQKMKMPRGKNQTIILKVVRELLEKTMPSETEKHPEFLPVNGSWISLEDAITTASGRLTCVADQRNRSARQAITGLVNLGILKVQDGYLWEP